ncbi:MAG: hypothetical protein AAFQ92_27040, partial [Bacteroidota bacterium]
MFLLKEMSYEYNAKAHYAPYGGYQELITGEDLTKLNIVVRDDNEKSESFSLRVPDDLFDLGIYKYLKHGDFYIASGGYQTAKSAWNFQHNPMALWETQLNFAVHCATSGLGISTEHLDAKRPLVRALYRFHTYYHVRRILSRIGVPTPSQEGFDKYNNAFSLEEVKRVGNEYGCDTENMNIYRNHYYFDRSGVGSQMTYSHNNWSRWIMNSSRGFTKHGMEKIGESIRAYVYLILSSQHAARHGIIGDGAQAAAAQEIFVDNLEAVIKREVSLEDDIALFQSVLKHARSGLDYSVGRGLYMIPSNMLLKPLNQVIEGYNNKIVVNTGGAELGKSKSPRGREAEGGAVSAGAPVSKPVVSRSPRVSAGAPVVSK